MLAEFLEVVLSIELSFRSFSGVFPVDTFELSDGLRLSSHAAEGNAAIVELVKGIVCPLRLPCNLCIEPSLCSWYEPDVAEVEVFCVSSGEFASVELT